jgi:hypothetical protein
VSSALLSLLCSNQINVALELHHSITNTTHPFPPPIAPGNLAGDPTTADARHLAVDRPSQAPFSQINPSTMIPYHHACLATSPTTLNRDRDGEPSRSLTGGRLRSVPPPVTPSNVVSSPPRWRVGPHPQYRPCAVPRWWAGCPPARAHAQLGRKSPPPPGPASRKSLFFFLFPFLFPIFIYLCIY